MTRVNLIIQPHETTLARHLDMASDADRRAVLAELMTFAGGNFAEDREVDPQTLRAVMLTHRFGCGLQMRIDGLKPWKRGDDDIGATFCHVGSGDYGPSLYDGWTHRRDVLPDGSLRVVARAIAVAARQLLKPGGAWRYVSAANWEWVEGAERKMPTTREEYDRREVERWAL